MKKILSGVVILATVLSLTWFAEAQSQVVSGGSVVAPSPIPWSNRRRRVVLPRPIVNQVPALPAPPVVNNDTCVTSAQDLGVINFDSSVTNSDWNRIIANNVPVNCTLTQSYNTGTEPMTSSYEIVFAGTTRYTQYFNPDNTSEFNIYAYPDLTGITKGEYPITLVTNLRTTAGVLVSSTSQNIGIARVSTPLECHGVTTFSDAESVIFSVQCNRPIVEVQVYPNGTQCTIDGTTVSCLVDPSVMAMGMPFFTIYAREYDNQYAVFGYTPESNVSL